MFYSHCKPWPYLVNVSPENSRELCKLGDNLSQLGLKSCVEFWRSSMYYKFVVNKSQMLSLLLEIDAFLKKKVMERRLHKNTIILDYAP